MTTRRTFMTSIPAASAAVAVAPNMLLDESGGAARAQTAPLEGHFHPKGKAPSEHTLKILAEAKETLPFDDTQDFDEVAKGLIAEMPERQIMADAGTVAWDRREFDFIDAKDDYDSIHPSLMRIGKLNQNYGLYEVITGI